MLTAEEIFRAVVKILDFSETLTITFDEDGERFCIEMTREALRESRIPYRIVNRRRVYALQSANLGEVTKVLTQMELNKVPAGELTVRTCND